jgi:hypothetical protein
MPRHRPQLKGWDDSWVSRVNTPNPEAWVRAVLGTPLVAVLQNPRIVTAVFVSGGRRFSPSLNELPPFITGMRFGEVSEAIRRVLSRRESEKPEADRRSDYRISKDANLKTNRGLRSLSTKGAIIKQGKLYRLSPDWGWAQLTTQAFDLCFPALAAGTMDLEHKFRQLRGRRYLEVQVRRKGARTPELYYGIRLTPS